MTQTDGKIYHVLRMKESILSKWLYFPRESINTVTLCATCCESHSVVSDSLWPHGLNSPWNSPGQNTGVGSLSLLQGIFPTQGLNSGLSHCRQILYQLSHQGSPKILEWVAYPFSSRSSSPRKWTGVSCMAGRSLPAEISGKPMNTVKFLSNYQKYFLQN